MTHENLNECVMNADQQLSVSGLDELVNRTSQIKHHLCEYSEIIEQVADDNLK